MSIAFQEDTVYQRNEDIKKWISLIDTSHIDDETLGNQLSIEYTILYDSIFMCPGWEYSKLYKVEKFTAEIYGKEVLYNMKRGTFKCSLLFCLLKKC